MRGAYVDMLLLFGAEGRFIPTCVGHTMIDRPLFTVESGSSPHAWGILAVHNLALRVLRFIPTCVGHTIGVTGVLNLTTGSSPHAWGIRDIFHPVNLILCGSSPHVWGILFWR